MNKLRLKGTTVGIAVAMATTTIGTGASAMPLDIGNGWDANWNTTISTGIQMRAENPSSKLYTQQSGNSMGMYSGTGGTVADGGNLNYKRNDITSILNKVVSDIEVKRDDMGALVRVKAWYDPLLDDTNARFGNQANGYTRHAALSDSGFPALQRFQGAALMDAYVFDSFEVANKPLQVRLGHQVVNWGESLFVQGINQLNPLDIASLHQPGTEIREVLMPVWGAYANLGLGGGVSLEGFYQFKSEAANVDACGSYWATVDTNIGTSAGACNKIIVGLGANSAGAVAAGNYAPLIDGPKTSDMGQFGLSLKVPVDKIDTEFGLYAMNIHSRTPIISSRTGKWAGGAVAPYLYPIMAHVSAGAATVSSKGYWEFPEDVQYYGVSAATNLAGWSIGSEFSFTPNLPVQRNGNDMLNGMLTGTGPLGSTYNATSSLTDVRGYDRFQKSQIQINGVKQFGGIAGASKSTLMGEAAAQYVNVPDYRSGSSVRYGRAFIFGTASSSGNNTCGSNPQSDGCQNDGFVTNFSWGYRLRGSLEYPEIFGTGVTFTPSLSVSHDVQGVSADNQFIEDRFQVGLNGHFSYDNRYGLDVGYVYFGDWAKYDPLRDHDFYSLSLSATF